MKSCQPVILVVSGHRTLAILPHFYIFQTIHRALPRLSTAVLQYLSNEHTVEAFRALETVTCNPPKVKENTTERSFMEETIGEKMKVE